jgi:hypothetical protein
MKNNLMSLFNVLILVGSTIIIGSCGGETGETGETELTSVSELSSYVTEHNFFKESSLSESETYSFDGSSFMLTLKNKRSGSERTFDGSYEVKSAKYSDKGEDFLYVKLVFNDPNYADELYFVYDYNSFGEYASLIKPSKDYNPVLEDEYGLCIKREQVNLAPNYNSYSSTAKN